MLQAEESLKKDITVFANFKIGDSISLYFEVEDLENFYNLLQI
jgi:hypothetical protein